jgi:hypothetical protein
VITVDRPVLVSWRVAEELESTGRRGASDGGASDASVVRKTSLDAYWSASDAGVRASDGAVLCVRCELN